MKVILNVDAITHPITGIGQYTLQLGRQLAQHQSINDIKYFSADHWVKDIEQTATDNQWLSVLRRWIPFKPMALNLYAKKRANKFSKLTKGMKDYVFHSPNFVLMPFAGKSVATFHDLSFIHYRQTQPKYRLQFLDREIPKTLTQADGLITPSEFVKQEIIEQYGYPADQIHVTPLGVSESFKPYSETEVIPTLHKFQLQHKQFILSVATAEPRKNLGRLLAAYSQLPKSLRKVMPLVLVGSKGWLNQDLHQQIRKLVNQGQILSLGYVSQAELQQLYAAAKLTAFPSFYEGFGLPIIESMASGTPVLTSQNSAMQEVAAGHAMLCDPLNTDSIVEALQQAVSEEGWLAQSQQAGLQHAKSFTWQRCAELTVKAFEE